MNACLIMVWWASLQSFMDEVQTTGCFPVSHLLFHAFRAAQRHVLPKHLIPAQRLAIQAGNCCCCCYIRVAYKGTQWLVKLSSPALRWDRAPKSTTLTVLLIRNCSGCDFEIYHWVVFATCTGLNTLGYRLPVN